RHTRFSRDWSSDVCSSDLTEIALAWTDSTDDCPLLLYRVIVNGSPNVDAGQNLSAVVHRLTPETTYEITVKGRDFYAGNVSAPRSEERRVGKECGSRGWA